MLHRISLTALLSALLSALTREEHGIAKIGTQRLTGKGGGRPRAWSRRYDSPAQNASRSNQDGR